MWRHQTMCRQRMWRQNVASQENVASPNNVAPNNVAPKCGVAKQCGAKQCGAKMWRHRKMWRHQTMWRQTMQRQNVASQENAASPNNVAPNNVAPHVFEMCLHYVSSASGGKVRALLPTPWIFNQRLFFGANGTSSECFLQVFWMLNDGDMILVWCTITWGIIFWKKWPRLRRTCEEKGFQARLARQGRRGDENGDG